MRGFFVIFCTVSIMSTIGLMTMLFVRWLNITAPISNKQHTNRVQPMLRPA